MKARYLSMLTISSLPCRAMPVDLIVRHFLPADGTQKGSSKFLLQLKKKEIDIMAKTNFLMTIM